MTTAQKPKRPFSAKPSLSLDTLGGNGASRFGQDLLIARYLEEFAVHKPKNLHNKSNNNKRPYIKSPYAGSIILNGDDNLSVGELNKKSSSRKYLQPHPPSRRRPISAPTYRLGTGSWTSFDDLSYSYSASVVSSSSSKASSKKPLYKRKYHVICVQAFVNGSREYSARVAAPDLSLLLSECTQKLGLTSAARKLFLGDGTPIHHPSQLSKDCEVYVSMGEAFKNPFLSFQEREKLKKSSFWTINGIVVASNNDKKTKRSTSSLTKRMADLIDSHRKRILVFKNGESFGGVEVVANRFDEFLDDCTSKLKLTSGARSLYDWHGKVVESFSHVPCLDKVLQPSSGIVLGPLWVTKGEVFSPKGAYDFLSTMILNTKERVATSKQYIEQLELHFQSETKHDLINDLELGSELNEELECLELLEEALPKLKDNLEKIEKLYKKEESMTSSIYKFKNISEIDAKSRLLGSQGLRLCLYPNGSGANFEPVKIFMNSSLLKKGIKTKKDELARFFDVINSSEAVLNLFEMQGRQVNVKRAFKINGTEVDDIDALEMNDQLWLTQGESFVPVHYWVVSLNLEKVKVISLWGFKEIVQRDLWLGAGDNQMKSRMWQALPSIPSECEAQEMKVEMSNEQKVAYYSQCSENRLPTEHTYLQCKQNHSLNLYPEITLSMKGDESDGEMSGSAIQQWGITQDGLIFNKHFKQLVLGVMDQVIQMTFSDDNGEEELLDGAVVSVFIKNPGTHEGDHNTLWVFTSDGYIQPAANPGYVLTAVKDFSVSSPKPPAEEIGLERKASWNIMNDSKDSQSIMVVENHSETTSTDDEEDEESNEPSNDTKRKRNKKKKKGESAEKTESDDNPDIQKYNEVSAPVENVNPFRNLADTFGGQNTSLVILPRFPEKHPLAANQRWALKTLQHISSSISAKWTRQDLYWPVDETGSYLQVFVDGFLTFGVPKLKWNYAKAEEVFKAAVTEKPVKLFALRNGETDVSRAVKVLVWDVKLGRSGGTRGFTESNDPKKPMDVEMSKFLERCTSALDLPFAARRLFTQDGKEVLMLKELGRDDFVYVSCGEQWTNPSISKAESQKRSLLANLSADVTKMKNFYYLKMQAGYIVQVHGDAPFIGKKLALTMKPEEVTPSITPSIDHEEEEKVVNIFEKESISIDEKKPDLTAHQRAHARQEMEPIDPIFDDQSCTSVSHRDFLLSSSNSQTHEVKSSFKWRYTDEFIHLEGDSNLVIGTAESEGSPLMLCQKNLEDPSQRWLLCRDGAISLKSNPSQVMSVVTPSMNHADGGKQDIYNEANLVLTNKKMHFNGNSNQIFHLDPKTGYLNAFATDSANMELSAALKAGICSHSVFGKTAIYQPGYVWNRHDTDGRIATLYFCDACGKSIRGTTRLKSLNTNIEFVCAMSEAKKHKIKMNGAFLYLNGKVDLSHQECEATIAMWDMQLQRLRRVPNIRMVASELTMSQNNPAVRVLARRNGESRSEGCLIIGNMLAQILDMCTIKLNLTKAARRLYSMDGELITDMQQLLKPYYPELTYMKHGSGMQLKSADNRRLTGDEKSAGTSLAIEKLDVRIPIDVWVSTGEPFVHIDEAEKSEILSKYEQCEKQDTANTLQIEKHRLRQAKGRRLADLSSHRFIKPVLMKELASQHRKEDQLQQSISQLQMQLEEVKEQQETRAKCLKVKRPASAKLVDKMNNMKLYQIPKAIKLFVFPNGENPERNDVIYAQDTQEVLDNATSKLALTSCARRIYTVDGVEVFSFEDLERFQVICVTCGEKFVPYRDRRNQMEMRASWSRANRRNKMADGSGDNTSIQAAKNAFTRPPAALPSSAMSNHTGNRQVFEHDFTDVGNVTRMASSTRRPASAKAFITE